jgi:hypothetical protein
MTDSAKFKFDKTKEDIRKMLEEPGEGTVDVPGAHNVPRSKMDNAIDKMESYNKRQDIITVHEEADKIGPDTLRAIADLASHYAGAYLVRDLYRATLIARDKTRAELEEWVVDRMYSDMYYKAQATWEKAQGQTDLNEKA